jgi:hypothetical protein
MEWLTKIMAIVSTNQMRTMMRIYECPLIVTTCSPRHWHQWCCPRQGLLMIRLGCYWCNARLSRYDKWEDWLGVTFGTTGSAQCSRVIIIFHCFILIIILDALGAAACVVALFLCQCHARRARLWSRWGAAAPGCAAAKGVMRFVLVVLLTLPRRVSKPAVYASYGIPGHPCLMSNQLVLWMSKLV